MANCIKCGKELAGTKVFCNECLGVMKEYPVPSGTPLIIHQREVPAAKKANAKKKALSPEEQVLRLRGIIRWLVLGVFVLVLALVVTGTWLLKEVREPQWIPEETKGQNYSTQITIPD